jgi:hypothetical protein
LIRYLSDLEGKAHQAELEQMVREKQKQLDAEKKPPGGQ